MTSDYLFTDPTEWKESERDFVRAVLLSPSDWTLKAVFADWLEEQGDVRAMGYRAMVFRQLRPSGTSWYNERVEQERFHKRRLQIHSDLPEDWFLLLSDGAKSRVMSYDSMMDAINAAAFVFLKLPPERQQELLEVPVL